MSDAPQHPKVHARSEGRIATITAATPSPEADPAAGGPARAHTIEIRPHLRRHPRGPGIRPDPRPVGGRKPKLTARQAGVARGMYDETGADGRRKYTVAEIAETFGVSRKTVYRHLEPSGGRRQPGKTTPL